MTYPNGSHPNGGWRPGTRRAMILTPSCIVNTEQMIISDVDLELVDEQRITGSVIPLTDLIRDAYDHVIHSVDRRTDAVRKS